MPNLCQAYSTPNLHHRIIKLSVFLILTILTVLSFHVLLDNTGLGVLLTIYIGLHECGHLAAARICRVHTQGFYFIPFLGGVAFMDTTAES